MADETLFPEDKITLFSVKNGQVLIWSAEDVCTLRKEYRIVGSLIGCLPRKPKQNGYLSLPLLLSMDETSLLLQKNFARLVKSPEDPPLPTQEEVEKFEALRKESIQCQLGLMDAENLERQNELVDIVETGRKRKKTRGRKRRLVNNDSLITPEKLLKIDNSDAQLKESNETKIQTENVDLETVSCEESTNVISLQNKTDPFDTCTVEQSKDSEKGTKSISSVCTTREKKSQTLLQIEKDGCTEVCSSGTIAPTAPSEDIQRHQACAVHIPTSMHASKTKHFPLIQWTYPETEIEKLKFKVFQDLWEKGYYVTSGSKFGGDFLAYPGDPFKFHSSYVVMVMSSSRKIGMLDLISIGRLAATVKKTAVLATVDTNEVVVYSSVKWSGIS